MANQEHITELIRQYAENTISKEAYAELMTYISVSEAEAELHAAVDEVWKNMNTLAPYSDEDADAFYAKMVADKRFKKANSGSILKLWPRIAAVAAAVALIVLGIYFFNYHATETSSALDPALAMNDIAPGKNGATLTLANGKVIQLSDAKSGVVIGDDKLAYSDGSSVGSQNELPSVSSRRARFGMGSRTREATITAQTTKGQTYIFTLPDGTKVWLNAASKLHIPSGFSGTETRKVELSGEAYFEVFKDKNRPFIVISEGQEVTVLGTHFNINSYADEASVKTTLLEGSVLVRHAISGRHPELVSGPRTRKTAMQGVNSSSPEINSGQAKILTPKELRSKTVQGDERGKQGVEGSVILKPNQQSVVTGSDRIQVKEIDPDEAIAWKSGFFKFNEERLEDILRKVSRWYNVEIVYGQEELKNVAFSGTVSRYGKVSALLKTLERTGLVHFKIEERRIVVIK